MTIKKLVIPTIRGTEKKEVIPAITANLKKLEHHINTLVLLWNKGKITET